MIAFNLLNSMTNWRNWLTGQGGSGDHGGAPSIDFRHDKSPEEIGELLAHSPLMRIACESYAEDITRAWRSHSTQAQKMMLLEEQFEMRDVVEKAIFYAEGYGGAFIIPRYAETVVSVQALAKPRKPGLKNGLLGFGVYAQHQLSVATNTQTLLQPNGLPMYYSIQGAPNIRIHHSWLFALKGMSKVSNCHSHSMSLSRINALGQSRVDHIYDDFSRMAAGYSALSHILVKGNIDILAIKGLAEALSNCSDEGSMQTVLQKLVMQASATVTGANSFQPIVIDSEEKLERKGGNHTGAADIVRELQTMFVAATRIPRTRLFGEQAKGLGNGGEADLTIYYDRCAAYRERRCTSLVNWVDAIMAPGTRTKWEYNPLWELSSKDQVEVDSKQAIIDTAYQAMGITGIVQAVQTRLIQDAKYDLPATYVELVVEEPNAPPN